MDGETNYQKNKKRSTYLFLAIKEFKADKKSLVFDYNRSLVMNTASDLDSFLTSLGDKMRLIAMMANESEHKRKELLGNLFRDNHDLVFVATSDHFEGVTRAVFENDLAEKEWVVLLEDQAGRLRGFSTFLMYAEQGADGERVAIVYSGDTIVDSR